MEARDCADPMNSNGGTDVRRPLVVSSSERSPDFCGSVEVETWSRFRDDIGPRVRTLFRVLLW